MDENGEPWFLASDVCAVLGYKNTSKAITDHCRPEGVAKRDTPTESGNQEMTYINEGNLYRLIIKSRKPEAEPFESWVCDEVLPTIRKTGKYEVKQLPEPKTQKALPNGLTLEMQDCVKTLVKERVAALPKEKQGAAAVKCWSSIKKKFGKTYKEVEPEHFSSIISLLGRLPLEGELLEKPKENTVTVSLGNAMGLMSIVFDGATADENSKYLVTVCDKYVSVNKMSSDCLVMTEQEAAVHLSKNNYIVIQKDEFSIEHLVMQRIPARFLPVLIETAGARLKTIG